MHVCVFAWLCVYVCVCMHVTEERSEKAIGSDRTVVTGSLEMLNVGAGN
jgi:bacterioferritin-associated ferredoxin